MADLDQPDALAFSPDRKTLYVTDTSRKIGGQGCHIHAFDVGRHGKLTGKRPFYSTENGVPDGLAVDRRGWVWTAAGDGIYVIDASGCTLGFVPLPWPPTNCAFGGPENRRLFITCRERLVALDLRD